MTNLPSSYEVANQRRSIAMLSPGQWALKREDALDGLEQLLAAVEELERQKPQREPRRPRPR